MEMWDSLWPGGPVINISGDAMKPSTDSFLLADFARFHRGDTVVDLGAGGGILEVLLLARQPDLQLTGVEISASACTSARQTLAKNGMTGLILCGDIRALDALLPRSQADGVICNPPYFAPESGAAASGGRGIQRSELTLTLPELCAAADYALKYGGRFTLIYRTERLTDLLIQCREHRLEPKRMRLIQHRRDSTPELVLLECKKGGHPGLKTEPPLQIENGDGTETEDVRRAYFRDKE